MAAFAIPSYQRILERNHGKNAEFNLQSIYNAQKTHKLSQGSYFSCADTPCTDLELEQNLGVYIRDLDFNYTIAANNTSFTATAARQGGMCAEQEMTVGHINSTVTRGCDYW